MGVAYVFTFKGLERVEEFCRSFCSEYRVEWSGPVYPNEDKYLFMLVPLLIRIHTDDYLKPRRCMVSNVKVRVHTKISGREVDVYVKFTATYADRWHGNTTSRRNYSIGVELKDSDVRGAVEQAVERRNLATWFYAAIGIEPHYVMYKLLEKPKLLKAVVENGLGVVAYYGSVPVVLFRSTITPRPIVHRMKTILDYIEQYNKYLRENPDM